VKVSGIKIHRSIGKTQIVNRWDKVDCTDVVIKALMAERHAIKMEAKKHNKPLTPEQALRVSEIGKLIDENLANMKHWSIMAKVNGPYYVKGGDFHKPLEQNLERDRWGNLL
jgi:hypothetical protein